MTFVDRRQNRRNLGVAPARFPEPEGGEAAAARAEALRADLANHPGLASPRLLSLGLDLSPGGRGPEYVAALRPLWHLAPPLHGRGAPGAVAGEGVPAVRAGLAALDPGPLDATFDALLDACGHPADPEPAPCASLAILARIHQELVAADHFWVTAGAQGVGLPLAWVLLWRHLVRALDASEIEFDAAVAAGLRGEGERERAVLNGNLEALGPFLHDPEVAAAVRVGAERFLDGWQVMFNGIDRRVYGGVQAL